MRAVGHDLGPLVGQHRPLGFELGQLGFFGCQARSEPSNQASDERSHDRLDLLPLAGDLGVHRLEP
jgi:hypothetical protein